MDAFPRLAWAARISMGSRAIEVLHGPWVEVREDRFFEGAWDGEYSAGAFDAAGTFTGSGARITQDGVLFSAAADLICPVFSVRSGSVLWFSNSLVNLLVRTGDRPDPAYGDYYHDFLHVRSWGIRPYPRYLPTANGNRVSIHLHANFHTGPDLRIRRSEKSAPPSPTDFREYRDLLADTIGRLFENAGDPGRTVRYEPLASVSRGYDSTAVATLAAEAGCMRAISVHNPPDASPELHDDGSENAGRLGMRAIRREKDAYLDLPAMSEAEFCAGLPTGSGILKKLFEPEFERALYVTGFSGDMVWSVHDIDRLPKMMSPRETHATEPQSYTEFRLRVGFLHFSPAFIGSIHREKIQDISRSPEMAPWSVPGDYDRPIPRRIAEEAGIPRASFGQVKRAAGSLILTTSTMLPGSREDYIAYCRAHGFNPHRAARRPRLVDLATLPLALLTRLLKRFPDKRPWRALAPLLLLGDQRLLRRRPFDRWGYSFHWGFERVKERYE